MGSFRGESFRTSNRTYSTHIQTHDSQEKIGLYFIHKWMIIGGEPSTGMPSPKGLSVTLKFDLLSYFVVSTLNGSSVPRLHAPKL